MEKYIDIIDQKHTEIKQKMIEYNQILDLTKESKDKFLDTDTDTDILKNLNKMKTELEEKSNKSTKDNIEDKKNQQKAYDEIEKLKIDDVNINSIKEHLKNNNKYNLTKKEEFEIKKYVCELEIKKQKKENSEALEDVFKKLNSIDLTDNKKNIEKIYNEIQKREKNIKGTKKELINIDALKDVAKEVENIKQKEQQEEKEEEGQEKTIKLEGEQRQEGQKLEEEQAKKNEKEEMMKKLEKLQTKLKKNRDEVIKSLEDELLKIQWKETKEEASKVTEEKKEDTEIDKFIEKLKTPKEEVSNVDGK